MIVLPQPLHPVNLTNDEWYACRQAFSTSHLLQLSMPPGRLTRAALGITLGRPVDEAEATTIVLILQATT